jgi:sucrose phosphorylase
MNAGAMLNAYPDSMGGKLTDIVNFLSDPAVHAAFRSLYILPSVFNTDLDRGFSVISYDLNKILTSPDDIPRLQKLGLDLKLDFILNHLSVLSPQFQDILAHGDASAYRDFFINWNTFWKGCGRMTPEGYIQPDERYIRDMYFRKPGLPILMVRYPDGAEVPYWNTFFQEVHYDAPDTQDLMRAMCLQYSQAEALATRIAAALNAGQKPAAMDFSDMLDSRDSARLQNWLDSRRKYLGQMDVNLQSELVWQYYESVLDQLAGYGASIVRLDAFGYASKIPGRRNFVNAPETWDILERLRQMADKRGMTLLPEIHASYAEGSYRELSARGYMAYDFFLPGLLIDAIENHDAQYMARWAREQQERHIRCVNMLGCHDGIPVLDLAGLVPDDRIQRLIDLILSRGGIVRNLHGQKDIYYQVYAAYYSALGEDDRKLLLARALQLFMPGKPQVWYWDLLVGKNDSAAVHRGGAEDEKAINRTNLTTGEVARRLQWPIVQEQLKLLKMRNECPAFGFDAELQVSQPDPHSLCMEWHNNGQSAVLRANLITCAFSVEADMADGVFRYQQD